MKRGFTLLFFVITLLPGLVFAQVNDSSQIAVARQSTSSDSVVQPAAATIEPATAPAEAVLVAADENGFNIRSADQDFQLRLRGDVQADGRFFNDADLAPGSESFYLRRVRLVFQGTVFKRFDFRIMPNFGMGRAELQDAYLDARFFPFFGVRAGKFKVPVGLELLQSPTDALFIEQSYAVSLGPNRDVGVQLHGELLNRRLAYQFGFFNGSADGASIDADLNNSKDVVARVFATPFRGADLPLKGLGLGIAVTTGTREGTAANPDLPSFRTTGRQTFFRYLAGGESVALAAGTHTRIVPQGYFYHGPVGLMSEYAVSRQEVQKGDASTALSHRAWHVAGSIVLTGENATYGRLKPRAPYDGNGNWGAFEVVGRVHSLQVDGATFPTFADPARTASSAFTWGLGLNWYVNSNVRLSFNYEQTSFDAAGGADRRDTEHVLLSRFQIAF